MRTQDKAARVAEMLDMITAEECNRIEHHISLTGLPILFPAIDVVQLLERFSKDKKAIEGKTRFVLPTSIGKVIVRDDVPIDLIKDVIEGMKV